MPAVTCPQLHVKHSLAAYMPITVAIAAGSANLLCRPCVDCGRLTGSFCDFCKAATRLPHEVWAPDQMTPLCTRCDDEHGGACRFCREEAVAAPSTTQTERTKQ